MLNNAKVGEAPTKSGVALPGSVVEVTFEDGVKEKFLIATRQEGVTSDELEVYSPNSPLGAALIDKEVGAKVTYTLPSGKPMTVTLDSAVPYHS